MKLIPTLMLIAVLSTGCAFSITGEGLFLAAGDSNVTTEETTVTGGSVSESFSSLIEGLASLIPFTNPPAPDVNVTVEVPGQGEE